MSTAFENESTLTHARDRTYTEAEIESLTDQMNEAYIKGDKEEFVRIARIIPLSPIWATAIKEVYGKDYLLGLGFDLTEATFQLGEGWLDES